LHRLFARIGVRAIIIPHVASRLKPVNAIWSMEARFVHEIDRPCSISRRKFSTNVLAATNFLTNFVLALALVQHLSRDRAFECAHRL
jgi:hypothetical protein